MIGGIDGPGLANVIVLRPRPAPVTGSDVGSSTEQQQHRRPLPTIMREAHPDRRVDAAATAVAHARTAADVAAQQFLARVIDIR